MPSVLAIAAHPDDIEFVMAGTMLQLAARGWNLHYFNVSDGGCGSLEMDRETTAKTRLAEARQAAETLGATFYPPLTRDMEVLYSVPLMRQVAAVVRRARPSVILTHAPVDYMEDHQEVCRLAVSAAFSHSFTNLDSDPPVAPYVGPVTVYHAQPHGNATPLGEPVRPGLYVDVTDQMEAKRQALSCHASQKAWLDATQGMDSYLHTMRDLLRDVGRMSGKFEYAEGWRRRQHWGFCGPDDDPLRTVLADCVA